MCRITKNNNKIATTTKKCSTKWQLKNSSADKNPHMDFRISACGKPTKPTTFSTYFSSTAKCIWAQLFLPPVFLLFHHILLYNLFIFFIYLAFFSFSFWRSVANKKVNWTIFCNLSRTLNDFYQYNEYEQNKKNTRGELAQKNEQMK